MRDFIRLGGKLFLITAVVAFALALGNYITKDKIDALAEQEKSEAQQAVLEGINIQNDSGKEIQVKEESSVKSVTQYTTESGEKVFAISCGPKGYGGEILMMVGVDENLKVTGVSIIDNANETPGLGARVSEPEFFEQFIGKTKGASAVKNASEDNEVQAITGATISSKAVAEGVNDAVNAAEGVLGR